MPFFKGLSSTDPAPVSAPADESGSTSPAEKIITDKNENVAEKKVVSKEEEARLIKKLDIRIVPMMVWMYLMSFMDRGKSCTPLQTSPESNNTTYQSVSVMPDFTTWRKI